MKYIESLASYVPGLIVDQLTKDDSVHHLPWRQEYETVCVFCDVSGFTALSEAMQMNGKGAEGLAKHLNSYFSQMVRLIASEGGDVFKFAGDAMIVLWPESDDIEVSARRAAQCAFAIQKNLHRSEMEAGVSLSVKIGIGVGRVSVLHVGGTFNRVEYLAVGDPLIQAFAAEGKSVSGEVICSKDVWKFIHQFFTAETVFDDGYVRFDLQAQNKLVPKSSKMKTLQYFVDDDPVLEKKVKSYVAGAVLPNLNRDSPEDEQWGNEIRRCTVVFVNLGLKESHMVAAAVYDEAMVNVHEVLTTTQKCIYQYEGSINKFLLDDKGSTLIACFGLPPLAHDDDPGRAVLASLFLCQQLFELGLQASIGITTGDVFCGVVGSKTRREYTVLGDSVNLSARLMQKAGTQGGGVLCDQNTRLASGGLLHFNPLGEMTVKGKSIPVKVFQPYPSETVMPAVPNFRGKNPFEAIHKQQLQNVIIRRTFSSLEGYFSSDAVALHAAPPSSGGSVRQKSKSGGRRASMVPSFGISEDPVVSPTSSSVQNVGLMDHVRKGGHGFRTRKSIVRSSYDFNAADLSMKDAPSTSAAASAIPRESHQRRCSVLGSYKLSKEGPQDTGNKIHVIVPTNLATDTLISNDLEPLNVEQFSDLVHLRAKIYELALQQGYITSDIVEDDLRLNVAGTRFFLPVTPYNIKWLSAFCQEAKSGFNDNWLPGDPIDLIVFSIKSMRATQSRLALAHCALLESKISLLESSRGSVTLIEGEVGVGKTHFIMRFISNTLFNTCPVYFSPATSYSTEALGPFQTIVRQYLDSAAVERGCDRTTVLCGLLRPQEELYLDSPLLDEVLGTLMHEKLIELLMGEGVDSSSNVTNRLAAMTNEESSARRFQLLLYLVLRISMRKPTVVIIDDAQNLDDDSWALLLLLSLIMHANEEEAQRLLGSANIPQFGFSVRPKIMIVAAFRPLVKHRSVFKAKSAPYEALVASPSVSFLKLDGLPPEEVEELLVASLQGNVVSISDDFYKLVELKCMANPWMIKRLLEALQQSQPPTLHFHLVEDLGGSESDLVSEDSSTTSSRPTSLAMNRVSVSRSSVDADGTTFSLEPMHVELAPDFSFSKCPLPLVVAQSFGTIFDRLNSCQRMILKTACHLGKQFRWSALKASYPLEGHKHRLQKEMNDLLSIGMVVEIPNISLVNKERTYHFISDFLMDFIMVLMLKDQKDKISSYVLKFHTDEETAQRKKFMKKNLAIAGTDGILKTGILEVQKEVSTSFWKSKVKRRVEGGWKHRFCVINHAGLSMYRDKQHHATSPGTATQVIYLRGATAHMEPKGIHGDDKEFVFRVDASSYLKEKQTQLERRSFIMNGSSEEDSKAWIYMLKYASEACEEMEVNVDSMKADQQHSDLTTNVSTETDASSSDADVSISSDVQLEVVVVGTKEMCTNEVFGASNCYICCSMGVDQRFTSVSFDSHNNYQWDESFSFPLSREQWVQDSIVFAARKKDIMMTDDTLGSATLELRSLPHDSTTEQTLWLPLVRRDQLEIKTVGHVCVKVHLKLSSELVESISNNSLQSVQESITLAIKASNVANQFHIPGRVNTIDDLNHLLTLAKLRDRGEDGSHKGESLRKRLTDYLILETSTVPDAAAMKRRASLVTVSGKEMVKSLESLLKVLKTGATEDHMRPTEESGSVNTMWVCQELRGMIQQAHTVAPHDDDQDKNILNPFEGVMEQTNDLDQHEQEWLTHYSQPTSRPAITVNVEKETSLAKKIRRASTSPIKKSGPHRRTLNPVKMHMAGGHSDESSTVVEPDIFDHEISEAEGYLVLDKDNEVHGPFSALQLRGWLESGDLHPQVFVRHGDCKNGHFFPLAVFERPLHRIVCQGLEDWPAHDHDVPGGSLNDYRLWNFNIWDLEPYELVPLSMLIMSSLGLSDTFSIDVLKWRAFMSQVTAMMTQHHNPYHNYYHISDVAQTCFVLLTRFEASHLFLSHEILALIVSAFVHDLDHPGLNNGYQVNKGTELAIRYNDASVLENHHCAKAFEVINNPECGILDSLDYSTRRSVRKLMISIILATDMTFHFALQADVTKLVSRDCFRAPTEASHRTLSMNLADEDRVTLLKVVLHVSDISNSAKVWNISKKWSDLVCDEFFRQGEREKEEGLPVSPSMDKDTTLQDELSLNFTDFIIAPYFFSLTAVLPKLSEVITLIEQNRAAWHDMLMTRLKSAAAANDPSTEENISKWEKREKLFLEAVSPVVMRAANKESDKNM